MSYGTKYSISFYDHFNDYYDLYIQERGYSAGVTTIKCGKNPFNSFIESKEVVNPLSVLVPQTAEIKIISESLDQFESLYTNDERKYKIVIRKSSSIIWQGFLRDEFYESEYTTTPYLAVFEAVDVIALLKAFEYKTDAGYYFTGKGSLLNIIGVCLRKVGVNQNIYDVLDVYEDSHDSTLATDSPLTQTYVDQYIFRDKNCAEVIEMILKPFGARIIQNNNIIVIERIANAHKTDRTYRNYDSDINYIDSGTFNTVISVSNASASEANLNVPINRSLLMERYPGLKKINYKLDFGVIESLIKDHDIFTCATPYTLKSGSSLEFQGTTTLSNRHGLKYRSDTVDTGFIDGVKLDLKLHTLRSDFNKLHILLLYIDDYSYFYWRQDSLDWFKVRSSYSESLYSWRLDPVNDLFELDFDVPMVKEDFPRIPVVVDGYFELIVFGKSSGSNPFIQIYFDEFKFDAIYPKAKQNIENEYDLDLNNNKSENIILNIGDAYTVDGIMGRSENLVAKNEKDGYRIFNQRMASAFCRNIFFQLDAGNYIPTIKWYIKGEESNKVQLIELLASQVNNLRTRSLSKLSSEFLAHYTPCSILSYNSLYYIIVRNEWDLKYARHTLTAIQIASDEDYILLEDGDILEHEDGDYVKK